MTFSDGVLTIDARRRTEKRHEDGSYVRREVALGNYRRQMTLPGDIRADDIRASFENGVLYVEVPRTSRPQPKRIQVASGEQRSALAGAGAGEKRR